MSVGSESCDDAMVPNVASSVGRALMSILRFFDFASNPPSAATELGAAFAALEAKTAGISTEVSAVEGGKIRNAILSTPAVQASRRGSAGLLGRIFLNVPRLYPFSSSKKSTTKQHILSSSLSVSDFDLLRVVGKGAFGKVMLVRKKHGYAQHQCPEVD